MATDRTPARTNFYSDGVEIAALIPVKSFRAAKARLQGHLTPDQRAELSRKMATRVVEAMSPIPVFIACDDELVANWAESLGAAVLWSPGLGLNGAVDHGTSTIAGKGADQVIIAHGDLPLPMALPELARPNTIVLVPDRSLDGTNVLSRPCSVSLPAAYGGGSFDRHLQAAIASGLPVEIRRDPLLSLDLDTVVDAEHPLIAPVVRNLLGATNR